LFYNRLVTCTAKQSLSQARGQASNRRSTSFRHRCPPEILRYQAGTLSTRQGHTRSIIVKTAVHQRALGAYRRAPGADSVVVTGGWLDNYLPITTGRLWYTRRAHNVITSQMCTVVLEPPQSSLRFHILTLNMHDLDSNFKHRPTVVGQSVSKSMQIAPLVFVTLSLSLSLFALI
jgi:hypothetical protein